MFELDETLATIQSATWNDLGLVQNETLTFRSSINNANSERGYSRGFQMRVVAENENGSELVLDWIIQYQNSCLGRPFLERKGFGWAVVVSSSNTHDKDHTLFSKSHVLFFSPLSFST
jgi:hypothetical protein